MGILYGLEAIVLLLLFASIGFLLFYKDGALAKESKVYFIIVIFSLIISVLAYRFSMKSIDIDKVMAILGCVTSVVALMIKKKMFFLSRILLIISMSINIVIVMI